MKQHPYSLNFPNNGARCWLNDLSKSCAVLCLVCTSDCQASYVSFSCCQKLSGISTSTHPFDICIWYQWTNVANQSWNMKLPDQKMGYMCLTESFISVMADSWYTRGMTTLTLISKQLTGKTHFILWLECFFKMNEQTCPVVCSTDRSKAVVPVLVLLFVALWFILRGDFLYFRVSFCSCVFQSF